MTSTDVTPAQAAPTREPLLSRALVIRFISIIASSFGFFLPPSAPPLLAESQFEGEPDSPTGALLAACVVGELITPWIAARMGTRRTLALGLIPLGAPLLVLLFVSTVPAIAAVGVVRGLGFAFAIVAGGALTVELIPASRRGEGLAMIGIVSGISSLIALPLGIWAAEHWGIGWVIVAGAIAPLLGVLTVPWLPRSAASGEGGHRSDPRAPPWGPDAPRARLPGRGGRRRSGRHLSPHRRRRSSDLGRGHVPLQSRPRPRSVHGRWIAGRVGDRRAARPA